MFLLGIRVRREVYVRLVPGYGLWVRHMNVFADVLCDARFACEVEVTSANRGPELGFWLSIAGCVRELKRPAVAGAALELRILDNGHVSLMFCGTDYTASLQPCEPSMYPGDSVCTHDVPPLVGTIVHVDTRARTATFRLADKPEKVCRDLCDIFHVSKGNVPPLFPNVNVSCVAMASVSVLRTFQKNAREAGKNCARLVAHKHNQPPFVSPLPFEPPELSTPAPSPPAVLRLHMAALGNKEPKKTSFEPTKAVVGEANVYLDNLTRFLQHMDADADVEIGLGPPGSDTPLVLTNHVKSHLSYVRHLVVPCT